MKPLYTTISAMKVGLPGETWGSQSGCETGLPESSSPTSLPRNVAPLMWCGGAAPTWRALRMCSGKRHLGRPAYYYFLEKDDRMPQVRQVRTSLALLGYSDMSFGPGR
jgi:hypothetical protein